MEGLHWIRVASGLGHGWENPCSSFDCFYEFLFCASLLALWCEIKVGLAILAFLKLGTQFVDSFHRSFPLSRIIFVGLKTRFSHNFGLALCLLTWFSRSSNPAGRFCLFFLWTLAYTMGKPWTFLLGRLCFRIRPLEPDPFRHFQQQFSLFRLFKSKVQFHSRLEKTDKRPSKAFPLSFISWSVTSNRFYSGVRVPFRNTGIDLPKPACIGPSLPLRRFC